jgi:hypothetical protein
VASARQLLIVAEVMAPVFVPAGAIHLDALLASAVARRDGLPPPLDPTTMVRVEIPIERSPCGRVHMCSSSIFGVECRETQYTNRRPPIAEYQTMGNERMRRVDIATGPNKGYRIPRPVCHLMADEVRWYARRRRYPRVARDGDAHRQAKVRRARARPLVVRNRVRRMGRRSGRPRRQAASPAAERLARTRRASAYVW